MDEYDIQIAGLMALEQEKFEKESGRLWSLGKGIFNFVWRSDKGCPIEIGCLTMIKSGKFVAPTPELTERIRNDSRLPSSVEDLEKSHLPVFAEYQREFDEVLPGMEYVGEEDS